MNIVRLNSSLVQRDRDLTAYSARNVPPIMLERGHPLCSEGGQGLNGIGDGGGSRRSNNTLWLYPRMRRMDWPRKVTHFFHLDSFPSGLGTTLQQGQDRLRRAIGMREGNDGGRTINFYHLFTTVELLHIVS